MKRRRGVALALGVAGAIAVLGACGGEEASLPPPVPPVTQLPALSRAKNVDTARIEDASAPLTPLPLPPPPPAPLPEPSFGSEPVKPTDAHAFRLAVALNAMRASKSGARIARMLSVLPEVVGARTRTGIDPFADGEWLLVYGARVAVPGPNANVLRHSTAEGALTSVIGDGGVVELFGVRDVLVLPRAGVIALVPADRASELAVALAKPIDSGVRPGELARIFVAEPSGILRLLPKEITRANVTVRTASDDGLDIAADAECPDTATCTSTAAAIGEVVQRQNSTIVRIATRNVLSSLTVKADGTKLRATLHVSPEQLARLLDLIGAQLGLPSVDPGDASVEAAGGALGGSGAKPPSR